MRRIFVSDSRGEVHTGHTRLPVPCAEGPATRTVEDKGIYEIPFCTAVDWEITRLQRMTNVLLFSLSEGMKNDPFSTCVLTASFAVSCRHHCQLTTFKTIDCRGKG